jgi:hypothetical protein
MKKARSLFVIGAGFIVCAVVALNTEAGRRPDPNAVDKVPSPFRGAVVSANATTLVVKGDVKVKGWQPGSGDPRPASGEQVKDTSVSHTISFAVKPDTKITRDGKAAQLKDVHVGDTVSVTFTVKEGSSLKHVTEVAVSSVGSDAQDQPKDDKKKAKQ